jgi:hypothetical protein
VRERAEALVRSAVDDINDPFSLVRLDGEELSGEPRLATTARFVEAPTNNWVAASSAARRNRTEGSGSHGPGKRHLRTHALRLQFHPC